MWLISALSFYFISLSLNLKISYLVVLLIVVISNFAIILPSAPGGIGLMEYAVIYTLSFFSINVNIALVFALLLRVLFSIEGLFSIGMVGIKNIKMFLKSKRDLNEL